MTQSRRFNSGALLKNWKSSEKGSDLSGLEQSGKSRWRNGNRGRAWGGAWQMQRTWLANGRRETAGTTQIFICAQKQERQTSLLLGKFGFQSTVLDLFSSQRGAPHQQCLQYLETRQTRQSLCPAPSNLVNKMLWVWGCVSTHSPGDSQEKTCYKQIYNIYSYRRNL